MRSKNNIRNKERAATTIRENEKQERGKEQHNAISLINVSFRIKTRTLAFG